MNKEEAIKKLNEYSSECHTQLAYSINGYKIKHPGDLRLCMYETDTILNYIKDLQHKLEDKQRVIDEFYKYFNNFDIKSLEEQGLGVEAKEFIIKPLEILERGKDENN